MFKHNHHGVLKQDSFVSHIFKTELRLPRVVLANYCSKHKADLSELPPHVKINSTGQVSKEFPWVSPKASGQVAACRPELLAQGSL